MQVPFFAGMKVLGMLRVPPEEEHEGLDISHHGGSAYPKEFSRLAGDLSHHGGVQGVRWVYVENVIHQRPHWQEQMASWQQRTN